MQPLREQPGGVAGGGDGGGEADEQRGPAGEATEGGMEEDGEVAVLAAGAGNDGGETRVGARPRDGEQPLE